MTPNHPRLNRRAVTAAFLSIMMAGCLAPSSDSDGTPTSAGDAVYVEFTEAGTYAFSWAPTEFHANGHLRVYTGVLQIRGPAHTSYAVVLTDGGGFASRRVAAIEVDGGWNALQFRAERIEMNDVRVDVVVSVHGPGPWHVAVGHSRGEGWDLATTPREVPPTRHSAGLFATQHIAGLSNHNVTTMDQRGGRVGSAWTSGQLVTSVAWSVDTPHYCIVRSTSYNTGTGQFEIQLATTDTESGRGAYSPDSVGPILELGRAIETRFTLQLTHKPALDEGPEVRVLVGCVPLGPITPPKNTGSLPGVPAS